LIYAKYAKDENVFQELQSQIPSICYSLYKDEIFTEKFIVEKFIRKTLNFKNFFARPEVEALFLNKAEAFTHWFTYAPFEDEEGNYNGLLSVENTVESKHEISKPELKEIADL
jgi:hypothetical protein